MPLPRNYCTTGKIWLQITLHDTFVSGSSYACPKMALTCLSVHLVLVKGIPHRYTSGRCTLNALGPKRLLICAVDLMYEAVLIQTHQEYISFYDAAISVPHITCAYSNTKKDN